MTIPEEKKFREILGEVKDKDLAGKLWMRWKVLTDLYWFGEHIYGLGEAKGKNGRKRLDARLHREMARNLEDGEDRLLIYPRLHMKTTWAKLSIVQRVLKDPFQRVGMWSRTSKLVRKELASIKNIFCIPVLRELFPDLIPDPGKNFNNWQKSDADNLTIWRDPEQGMILQENQIEVWGIDGNATGHHYDTHYYDDILNEQSITTPEQIEKVETWWHHIQAIKELTAVEKMTGTRYHVHDLYGLIMAEHHFGKNFTVRKAIEGGRPIYGFFTVKDLEKMKHRMGAYDFSCQMMNDPVPPEDRLFSPPYPMWADREVGDEDQYFYVTVDPAPTTKKSSNYTGICVASVPVRTKSKIYYHKAYRVKLPPDELASHIADLIVRYKPKRVGIEYGLQQALHYLIEVKIKDRERIEGAIFRPLFVPISIGKISKADKINRTIGAFVRDRRAYFRPEMTDLFNQMEAFNPRTKENDDDILDAASMMMQTVEYFAPSQWHNVEQYQMGGSGFTLESLFKKAPKEWWGGKFVYGRA